MAWVNYRQSIEQVSSFGVIDGDRITLLNSRKSFVGTCFFSSHNDWLLLQLIAFSTAVLWPFVNLVVAVVVVVV